MSEQKYNIKGTVEHIGEVEHITQTFSKRIIVIETDADGKYPQHVPIEFTNAFCNLLDAFHEGDEVTIWFNLRGRGVANNGRYYGSIAGWKIEPAGARGGAIDQRPSVEYDDVSQGENGDSDGLPF